MREVCFYVPQQRMPSPEVARAFQEDAQVPLTASGVRATEQAWIYQTYVRLHARGVDCRLVHEIPDRGVLVAFANAIEAGWEALSDDVFFVCVVADSFFHPRANWYVVQNHRQVRRALHATFLPHWPQPALVPRDADRGETFQNVYYYGHVRNLAPELRSERWRKRLRNETGLTFRARGSEEWHDYRDADAVVAVRSFGPETFPRKPATKLYNAWLAGVPALYGAESAARAERRNEYDYLEVGSPDELIEQLSFLKNNASFSARMRANAARRARTYTVESVGNQWRRFLSEVVCPRQIRWHQASSVRRKAAYAHRKVQRKIRKRLLDLSR